MRKTTGFRSDTSTIIPLHSRRFVFIWVLATVGMGCAILLQWDSQPIWCMALYSLYAVVLTMSMALTLRTSMFPLPPDHSNMRHPVFSKRLAAAILGLGILTVMSILLRQGAVLIIGSAMLGLWIILRQWQQVRKGRLVIGGFIGLGCGLATLLIGPGDWFIALLYVLVVPPLFVAGDLLLGQTDLACVRLLQGQARQAFCSFAWAGILSVPLILLNMLGDPSPGEGRIDQWWETLFAFAPALVEEIWARLFLTTLIYAWLRPAVPDRPGRAVGFAVALAAFAHGLAHYPETSLPSAMITSMFVGIPLGMLFISRDFESAFGYHLFPVLARFVVVFVHA